MSLFPEFNPDMLLENKGERWVTVMHRHVQIDGNGNIIAGLGGKFNGQPIKHAVDHLSSPEGSKKNKAKEETSSKKIKQALSILKNNPDLSTKELKDIFMKNLGMSPGGAAVYLHKVKKKLADEESSKDDDKTEKKVPVKKIEKPNPEKTEDKPEKTSKKDGTKLAQAEAIYKAMPGASSKEVQEKFKSQIGMGPGMAALYYHKIKKKLGNIESTDDKKHLEPLGDDDLKAISKEMEQEKKDAHDPIDATLYNEYTKKKKILKSWGKLKDDGKMGLDDLYDVMQTVKKQHPDHKIHNHPFGLADKMTSINNMSDDALSKMAGKYQGIDGKPKDQEKQVDTKDKKSSQDTDIKKKTENVDKNKKKLDVIHQKWKDGLITNVEAIQKTANDLKIDYVEALEKWVEHKTQVKIDKHKEEKGKTIASAYDKYTMGLINKAEALKQIYNTLDIDPWEAAKAWKDHEDTVNASEVEKQEKADKIYHEGIKNGDTFSEIATKIKKELGHPTNVIKYVDKANDNHIDAGYKHYKKMKFQGGDDYAITGALQKHLGLSYDSSWNMLDKLNTHHENESKNHLEKAIDIVSKYSHKTYGEKVDHVGEELGLTPEDAEQMTSKAHSEIKEAQKQHAKDLYKKAHHKGEDAMDTIQKIEDVLKVSSNDAKKLYNIAKNSFSPEELEKGYDSVVSKVDSFNGGSHVFYNHKEDTHELESEDVQEHFKKVDEAQKLDAHSAFDPHEHLYSPAKHMGFHKLPTPIKDMSMAVYDYTGSHYNYINSGLRDNNVSSSYKKTVKNMDKAFKHPSARVKEPTMVYRGYTSKFANKLEPGDILQDKGYMSTASYLGKATGWAASDAAVVHILLPKGANAMTVQSISAHTSEAEVLIARGAKLRIIKKEVRENPYANGPGEHGVTLYAEYILDEPAAEKPKAKKTTPLERLQKKAEKAKENTGESPPLTIKKKAKPKIKLDNPD